MTNSSLYRKQLSARTRAFLNSLLAKLDLILERKSRIEDYFEINKCFPWFRLWSRLDKDQQSKLLPFLFESKSQIGQDLFAILKTTQDHEMPLKGGFFVEFGATNGVNLSNTWLLEKRLHWTGILAEPCRHWHQQLRLNRECHIDNRCVAATTGLLVDFFEPNGDSGYKELSSMQMYVNADGHSLARNMNGAKVYRVPTVSLDQLLRDHNAPQTIDYLSVDTEGSELEIIETLPSSSYTFKVITVEHNMNEEKRSKIYDLMAAMGYVRHCTKQTLFDDWYTLEN